MDHAHRRVDSLRQEAAIEFVENVYDPIHNASNTLTFGDANFEWQKYWLTLTSVDQALDRAKINLQSGETAKAEQFLSLAEAWILDSEQTWMAYHGQLEKGAQRGANTSLVVAGTCGGIVTGGVLFGTFAGAAAGGLAVGTHFGGFALFSGEEEKDNAAPPISGTENTNETSSLPDVPYEMAPAPTPMPSLPETGKNNEDQKKPDISKSADIKGNGPTEEEKAELELQRQIRREIRATAKKYSLPNKEELIAWAKEHLTSYQQNHNIPLDPHLGDFFLKTEITNPEDGELVEKWNGMISEYKPTSGISSVEDLVKNHLFDKYLKNYSRGYAQLADFMKGFGGNCEAETKMIIASISRTGTQLPPGWQLGVQSFTDHIQAVGYNKDTGEVQELLTGHIEKYVRAPIYHPYYLLDGYLQGQGKDSPTSIGELLIVDGGMNEENGDTRSTNTSSVYRGEKGVYYDGKVPLTARLTYGSSITVNYILNQPKEQLGENSKNGNGSNENSFMGTTIEEFKQRRGDADFQSVVRTGYAEWGNRFGLFMSDYQKNQSIIFIKTEDAEVYNKLETTEEKVDFLTDLALKKMAAYDGLFQQLASALEAPEQLAAFDDKKLEDIKARLEEASNIEKVPYHPHRSLGVDENEYQRIFRTKARTAAPHLETFLRRYTVFTNKMKTKPEFFVMWLDKNFHRRTQLEFLKKMDNATKILSVEKVMLADEFDGFDEPIAKLENPKIFGFGKKAGFEAERKAQSANGAPIELPPVPYNSPIEVEVVDISHLPPDVQKAFAQAKIGLENRKEVPGQKVSKGTLQVEQTSKYTIKPETMIELILSDTLILRQQDRLPSRWTPELSRVFLKMNRDGKYDAAFKGRWTGFIGSRPQKIFTAPNPYFDEKNQDKMKDMEMAEMPHSMMGKIRSENNQRFIPPDIARILVDIKKREAKKTP
ncbi:MAG TPA: hypothetical protein DDW49_07200 [Deltaproteobacteria bacterium]|nr:hypothetical protein [Deltaproteobacteria bacterium]